MAGLHSLDARGEAVSFLAQLLQAACVLSAVVPSSMSKAQHSDLSNAAVVTLYSD